MAENLPESLNNEEAMPSQIMAQSEAPTDSTILQPNLNENITTTIETMTQQADNMSTLTTVSLGEEIASTCSMSVTETVPVITQVSVMSEAEAMAPEIGSQTILQTSDGTVLEEVALEQTSEVVTIDHNTIHVAISTDELNEGMHMSTNSISQNASPNLPPWASRLQDCELIGDSYRGYVTDEVELDLILTLHKQHTNSCWGTRQSPSSAKPSIRLMWKSQYVPYDGIPFLNTGRRATVMECQYGPRRKGCITKKITEYDEQGHVAKKSHRPTCPARIYIKKVKKFPEYRIDPNLEGKNVRQAQERALTTLRLAGIETGGEERFYVQLPLPIAHEYHDNDDLPLATIDDNQGQRLSQQVVAKVQEFVARGLTGLYTIKHLLKEFVEKELFPGQDAPPRHNKAYFPTIIDIQNHIHQAQMALAAGQLMPLPPLTNIPIISPSSNKEKAKKRKNPDKLSQTSQTIQGLQTEQAVASIQQMQEGMSEENAHQTGQESEHDLLQEQLAKIHSESSSAGQPQQQILITGPNGDLQMPTNKDGQVVIVVTSNNVFTSQSDSETPTTYALTNSQINSLSPSALGTFTSGNQAVLIAQQGENGPYLTHAPSDNILHVLNPGLTGVMDEGGVLSMMARTGQVTTSEGAQAQPSVPEQLLASQAAVAAVLNAAAASVGQAAIPKPGDQTGVVTSEEQEEPPAKRQAVGLDLSSLVKEAVYNQNQISGGDISQSQATIQGHVMSTAQLNAALQAQAAAAMNTNISYHSAQDSKAGQQVVTMVTQPGSENDPESTGATVLDTGALHGYQIINIPETTAAQLAEGGFSVSELNPVTMETSNGVPMESSNEITMESSNAVTMETSNSVTIETSNPVTFLTSQLVDTFNMPTKSVANDMVQISDNLPPHEGHNTDISDSTELTSSIGESELASNTDNAGCAEASVNYNQALESDQTEEITSETDLHE